MNPEENQNREAEVGTEETSVENITPENQQQAESEPVEGDVNNTKTFAVLGYIVPILFFIPLIDEKTKKDTFAKFHANQQLILLILFVALQFLHSSVFMMLGGLGNMMMSLASLVLFGFAVFGALHAYKGKMKELPFIGHFRILK